MDVKNYLSSKSALIEQKLSELIPEKNVPYNQLFCAARYSLLGKGKRLRPILTLATVETLGGCIETALFPACALEMIHTYSLIHDDLPCMDDDDFRRGKPSLHRAFSESSAVLTGDYLLTYAFEVIAQAPNLTPLQKIQLIDILAKNSGSEGMVGGQIMDVEAEEKNINLETLQQIHRRKTGALLTASILFGAIIANASKEETQILQQFGQDIGLAFQIIDDVLDVTSAQKHGKERSSDIVNQKATYVSLLGIEPSKNIAYKLLNQSLELIQKLNKNIESLESIAKYMIKRHSE